MTREAQVELRETGLVPVSEGWFILNARDAQWLHAPDRSAVCEFEGDVPFAQVGINLSVLEPGQAMSRYHWEDDQEDFVVLSGAALLIIEGQERPLRAWDLVHCPAGSSHVIMGSGSSQCLVLAIGARDQSTGENWGAYPVDTTALKHHVGVERETTSPAEAYAGLPRRKPVKYNARWLPGGPG